jgi:hypothetical protein
MKERSQLWETGFGYGLVAASVSEWRETPIVLTAGVVGAALCRDEARSDRISRGKAAPTVSGRVSAESVERVEKIWGMAGSPLAGVHCHKAYELHSLTLAATGSRATKVEAAHSLVLAATEKSTRSRSQLRSSGDAELGNCLNLWPSLITPSQ